MLLSLRPARARVDLDRLAANYDAVAAYAPVPLMPVVKADAYGHGAVAVARRLVRAGATRFAVAYPEEGAELRDGRHRGRHRGAGGLLGRAGAAPRAAPADADRLDACAGGSAARGPARRAPGGRAREGRHGHVAPRVRRRRVRRRRAPPVRRGPRGRGGDDPPRVRRRVRRRDGAPARPLRRGRSRRWRAAACGRRSCTRRTARACRSCAQTHTLVRPGLLLYGLRPRPLGPDVAVRPVMTVSADVALVKDVPAGTAVSYGGRWIASRPSRIATVPLGYADGVPRTDAMRTAGAFALASGLAPVAGTICMDLTMLDVTDHRGRARGRRGGALRRRAHRLGRRGARGHERLAGADRDRSAGAARVRRGRTRRLGREPVRRRQG